jgi:hypothetical protein
MESIKIEGVEPHQGIYVDTIGEDVWVNIIVRNGSANLCITPDGADKLIQALLLAIAEVEHES